MRSGLASSLTSLLRLFTAEKSCGYLPHFIDSFWDIVVESFDQLRIIDFVHEARDSHTLRSALHMHAFSLKKVNKCSCWLPFPLLDVVEFHRILGVLLLLEEVG